MEKTVSSSKSYISEFMLPGQANPAGNVHGGEIMKMMDNCGAVAAMRHAKKEVVTVRVDELEFIKPISVGQLVVCEAVVAFVGHTSMEIRIEVRVEDMVSDVPASLALTAFFTYVALDGKGKPTSVPGLITETPQEAALFGCRKEKYLERKKNKRGHV